MFCNTISRVFDKNRMLWIKVNNYIFVVLAKFSDIGGNFHNADFRANSDILGV